MNPLVTDELVEHALRAFTEPGHVSDQMRMRTALEVVVAYLARQNALRGGARPEDTSNAGPARCG